MKTRFGITMQLCGCALILLLATCSKKAAQTSSTESPQATKPAQQPRSGPAELSEAELSQMNPHELAQHIFEHNGCNSCHTLGERGQFGYTPRGQQIHQQAEGCIYLLTAMNVIAQTPQTQWTAEERTESEHFEEYGCTACHQITPGKMGLTATGSKLADSHMSCPEVEHLLNERRQ